MRAQRNAEALVNVQLHDAGIIASAACAVRIAEHIPTGVGRGRQRLARCQPHKYRMGCTIEVRQVLRDFQRETSIVDRHSPGSQQRPRKGMNDIGMSVFSVESQ